MTRRRKVSERSMPSAPPSIRDWPLALADYVAGYFRNVIGCAVDISQHPVGMHDEMVMVQLRTETTSAFVQINARRHSPDELQLSLPTRAIFGERETVLAWSETFLDAHPVGTKLAGGHVKDVSIAEPGLTKPWIIVTVKAAHA